MKITKDNFNEYKRLIQKLDYFKSKEFNLFFPCELEVEETNIYGISSMKYKTTHRYDSTLVSGICPTKYDNESTAAFGYVSECYLFTCNLSELLFVYGHGELTKEEIEKLCSVECCFVKHENLNIFYL